VVVQGGKGARPRGVVRIRANDAGWAGERGPGLSGAPERWPGRGLTGLFRLGWLLQQLSGPTISIRLRLSSGGPAGSRASG